MGIDEIVFFHNLQIINHLKSLSQWKITTLTLELEHLLLCLH